MRFSIKILAVIALLFLLAQSVSASAATLTDVDWQYNGKPVEKIAFNQQFVAELTIDSPAVQTVTIKVKKDNINWFDEVVASKTVTLNKGENTVEIPFILTGDIISENGEVPAEIKSTRGVFVQVEDVYESTDVQQRFDTNSEIDLLSFYWVGLRMYVNGEEVDPDNYPDVYKGDTVEITGKLYEGGDPVSGQTIETSGVVSDLNGYSDTTDSNGEFSISTTAPDWESWWLCGDQGRYVAISADNLEGREYPLTWEFDCTYACEESEPTPTPTPTPTPEQPDVGFAITNVQAMTTAIGAAAIAGLGLYWVKYLR